jgi:hypothetical protein
MMDIDALNIKRVEFSDGTFISFEQAARRITKEKQLTKGYWMKNDLRPATGVLEEWTRCGKDTCIEPHMCFTPVKKRSLTNSWFKVAIAATNDQGIVESTEEHCLRMAQWLRGLKRG